MKQAEGPLVSVIIIFFNAGRFITEAIESVFRQSYPAWELLLVDDGSTDDSTKIARSYARSHPEKVRYLQHARHENRGMSASRNRGIAEARGTYLAFLDADDVWVAHTLEQQVAILASHPDAGLVYGPLRYWYSWRGTAQDRQRDYIEPLGVPGNRLVKPPRLVALFLEDRAAVPSGILVRREVVEQVGGFEEAFRGEYEDQVFCAKVCLHVPVFAADHCWYQYRQHPGSAVARGHQSGQTHAARLAFLTWLESYLVEQHLAQGPVWRALQREFWRYRRPRLFRWLRRWRGWTRRMRQQPTPATALGASE